MVTADLFKCASIELTDEADNTWEQKNASYSVSNEQDTLYNITTIANLLGCTREEVVTVYFMKHVLSIISIVRTGEDGGEPLLSRAADALNFLRMLVALDIDG